MSGFSSISTHVLVDNSKCRNNEKSHVNTKSVRYIAHFEFNFSTLYLVIQSWFIHIEVILEACIHCSIWLALALIHSQAWVDTQLWIIICRVLQSSIVASYICVSFCRDLQSFALSILCSIFGSLCQSSDDNYTRAFSFLETK